jgi:hypothetical protein
LVLAATTRGQIPLTSWVPAIPSPFSSSADFSNFGLGVPWNQEAMGGHHPNPKRGDRWKKWKFQSRSSIMFKLIWEAVIKMGGERKINNFDVNWLWTLFLTNTSGSYQFL